MKLFKQVINRNPRLIIILNLLPLFIVIAYVSFFAINVPVIHDWLFLNDIMSNDPQEWLGAFWIPTNGQRNIIPKLIYLLVFEYFEFNTIVLIYLNVVVVILSYLAIYLIFNDTNNFKLYHFLPVSWLFFNLVQYSNFLYAWQISLNLSVMGALYCFYFLQKRTVKFVILATIFALISYASFGNGLLVFPLGILFLILSKSNLKTILYWSVLSFMSISIYFINYSTYGNFEPSNLFQFYLFIANLLAMATILPIGKLGFIGYILGSIIGTIILILTIITLFLFYKKKIEVRVNTLIIIVFLYFSSVLFQITLGRSGNEASIAGAYSAQYTTFVILFLIFLYLTFITVRKGEILDNLFKGIKYVEIYTRRIIISLVLVTLLLGYTFGALMGPYSYGNQAIKRNLLQSIQNQDPGTYSIIRGTKNLIDHVDFLEKRNKASFLKGNKNNSILQPTEKSPLRFGNDSKQKFHIEDSLTFNFVCRVFRLDNLSLNLIVQNPVKEDSLVVELLKNKVLITEKTFKSKDVFTSGRVLIKLDSPLVNCMDSLYEIRLVRTGKSIEIPIYDPYYGGAICNNSVTPPNSCFVPALEFNTSIRMNYYYITSTLRTRIAYLLARIQK
ncbi:hypothetical protein ACFLTU_09540 [Bacteroidota bacterium]